MRNPNRPDASVKYVRKLFMAKVWRVVGAFFALMGAIFAASPEAGEWAFLGSVASLAGAVLFLSFQYKLSVYLAQREDELARVARSAAVDVAVDQIESPTDFVGRERVNRVEMLQYESIAQAQASNAHRNASLAMGAGMLIIAAGVAVAVLAEADAAKYSAAIVTAVGAATSGYIARTFIRVRDSASRQMAFYFQRPLVQSYLLNAERLASQLDDNDDRKTDQLVEIMKAALFQAANASTQAANATPSDDSLESPPRPAREHAAAPQALVDRAQQPG